MIDDRATPETATCAHLLDGAADELRTIRDTLASVSLEAAREKSAAEAIPPARPLRTRPVSYPPPPAPQVQSPRREPARASQRSPRISLAERLRTALVR